MFGYLADKAKAFSETVSEKVVTAKDAVLDTVGETAGVAVKHLEDNWDSIERVFVDGLLSVTHDRIKDDEVFEMLAEKAFELLPTPVRLLLPRAAFIAHSEKHRASIVEKIEAKRLERLAIGAPASEQAEI